MKNSIKNKAILVMVFSVATRLISFLFKIYLSREFGAELIGLYSMALAVFGLLTMIPSSGIPLSVSRMVAETNINKNSKRAYGIVSSGLIISLIVNTIVIGLFVIFRKPILSLLADERAETLVLIVLPATFSTCIYNVLRAYFMGKKDYLTYSVTELVEEILNVVIVLTITSGIIVAVTKANILILTFTIADILSFVLIAILYFVKKNKLAKPYGGKEVLKSSTPITFMRLFSSLTTTFTAILLPNRLVQSGATIQFATEEYGRATGMAYPLLFAPLAITSALSVVLLPEIAELNASNNYSAISRKLDKSMNISYAISALFFIIYFSLGEELCGLLFKDSRAGLFLSFASGMVLLISLCQLTTTSLNSVGKEKACFVSNTIGLALMILCLYLLPKYIGIYALAVGHTILFFVTFLLNNVLLCKLKITNLSYYKPLFIISVYAIVIATGIKYFKLILKTLPSPLALVICITLIFILYFLGAMTIKSYRNNFKLALNGIKTKLKKRRINKT